MDINAAKTHVLSEWANAINADPDLLLAIDEAQDVPGLLLILESYAEANDLQVPVLIRQVGPGAVGDPDYAGVADSVDGEEIGVVEPETVGDEDEEYDDETEYEDGEFEDMTEAVKSARQGFAKDQINRAVFKVTEGIRVRHMTAKAEPVDADVLLTLVESIQYDASDLTEAQTLAQAKADATGRPHYAFKHRATGEFLCSESEPGRWEARAADVTSAAPKAKAKVAESEGGDVAAKDKNQLPTAAIKTAPTGTTAPASDPVDEAEIVEAALAGAARTHLQAILAELNAGGSLRDIKTLATKALTALNAGKGAKVGTKGKGKADEAINESSELVDPKAYSGPYRYLETNDEAGGAVNVDGVQVSVGYDLGLRINLSDLVAKAPTYNIGEYAARVAVFNALLDGSFEPMIAAIREKLASDPLIKALKIEARVEESAAKGSTLVEGLVQPKDLVLTEAVDTKPTTTEPKTKTKVEEAPAEPAKKPVTEEPKARAKPEIQAAAEAVKVVEGVELCEDKKTLKFPAKMLDEVAAPLATPGFLKSDAVRLFEAAYYVTLTEDAALAMV